MKERTEVDDYDQSRGSGFLAPGTESVQEGEMPGLEEEVDTAEERRVAMERKRKGKKVATPKPGSRRESLPSGKQ